jgi:hypothetical protein
MQDPITVGSAASSVPSGRAASEEPHPALIALARLLGRLECRMNVSRALLSKCTRLSQSDKIEGQN